MFERIHLLGLEVVDCEGEHVGVTADTWPHDGSGEPEFVLVHVGRHLPRWRWLPAAGADRDGDTLRLRWTRDEVEDGPNAEDGRWAEPVDVARAFWVLADD